VNAIYLNAHSIHVNLQVKLLKGKGNENQIVVTLRMKSM
jgi:hypothetical protein